jgi:hypothetical protein
MNEKNTYIPKFTTFGDIKCRFGLFVRLYDGLPSRFPRETRHFYFRGDKYTDQEDQMLINLLNLSIKSLKKYRLMMLYDTVFPVNDEKNTPFKLLDGVVEKNLLFIQYPDIMNQRAWPPFIKPIN